MKIWQQWLVMSLAVAGFLAHTLSFSAARLAPRYDEVAYLALTRELRAEGGIVAAIRCYTEGRCTEDNRPPLYQLVLAPFVADDAASFARAKLVNVAVGLLLLGLVAWIVRRRFGAGAALATLVMLALQPTFASLSATILHDLLFAALTFAAVHAIASWQERGWPAWILVGALVGLAFLTKGSGYLLFLPLAVAALHRHRLVLWRRPVLYGAVLGFVAVSWFLLWRNTTVYGSPLFNFNTKVLWLDEWEQVWAMRASPEWERVGLGWYLERHSIIDLVVALFRGVGEVLGFAVYTSGYGPQAIDAPSIVVKALTGLGVMILAGGGVWRRFREGHRLEVVTVLSTVLFYGAALSLAARGGVGASERYVFPYVLLLLPYAAYQIVTAAGPWILRRLRVAGRAASLAWAVPAVLCAGQLGLFAGGFASDPRGHFRVAPEWAETSEWLSRNLRKGEKFAFPYHSLFSTFDRPFPDPDGRWSYPFTTEVALMTRQMAEAKLRLALIDTEDKDYPKYRHRLSGADEHGPLAFLGWPRCFHDRRRPSRFLIYCRPDRQAAAVGQRRVPSHGLSTERTLR